MGAMFNHNLHLVTLTIILPAAALETGCDGTDWRGCRINLTKAIFGKTTLPTRFNPDYIEDHSTSWLMHGCGSAPGNGTFLGTNKWQMNLQKLIWQIDGMVSLNSTVWYSRNTSGAAASNSPPPVDGASCHGPDASFPGYDSYAARSDTIVLHHNGHSSGHDCTPNYDTTQDWLNQLGYDVMEMAMPLHGCNRDNPQYGNPTSHAWFEQWEEQGDYTMRYFIEPVILTINYAASLGYKHIIMVGLSGGGWTTTVAAAVDPRITLSIPVAGSTPKFSTPLWPQWVPDLPEGDGKGEGGGGDYEQMAERPMYSAAGFVEMYVLAALEAGRHQLQMLHEWDNCCFRGAGLHGPIRAYNRFVQQHVKGWMQTAVNLGNYHELNLRDKVVVGMMIEHKRAGTLGRKAFASLPFDVLPSF